MHINGASKKRKNEAEKAKPSKRMDVPLEAETDSDPIVESDTTSQSGDDDGISWPSDGDEEDLVSQPEGDSHKLRSIHGADTNDFENSEVIADSKKANCMKKAVEHL